MEHSLKNTGPLTLDAVFDGLSEGKTLGDLRGLTTETIDTIYAIAASRFAKKQYADAERFLRFLCVHRHTDADLWIALARTVRMQGAFPRALSIYMIAMAIRPSAALCLETGQIYASLGEYERVMECVSEARQFPDFADNRILQQNSERLLAVFSDRAEGGAGDQATSVAG